jgi:hypothetical protein
MKLENQVCNLELSKELKKLGIKQESLFYWDMKCLCPKNDITGKIIYSAFTASELLELLPGYLGCWLDVMKVKNFNDKSWKYYIRYFDSNIIMYPTENVCEALAKMLIYLIKNKILEIK